MYCERTPPARLMAIITLFASTLDVLADLIMSIKLATKYGDILSAVARRAIIAYWVFCAVSLVVYWFEMVDVYITIKHGVENLRYARIAKSMVIALEEVPIPTCLFIIYTYEPTVSLAKPTIILACIKLVALVWGILKFVKLKFCWPCLPFILDHGREENTRRCLTFDWYRLAMIFVNICHLVAIGLVIAVIDATSKKATQTAETAADLLDYDKE